MNWAYIAGFFDGEGTFAPCLSDCILSIYQKEPAVLYRIRDFLSANGITSCMVKIRERRTNLIAMSATWQLSVSGNVNRMKFAKGVLPYLIVKKALVQDWVRCRTMFPALGASAAGRIGRERSTSKYGRGLHDKSERDSRNGRFSQYGRRPM